MARATTERKLALLELATAGVAAGLWYLLPELGWWPLIIALAPAVFRLVGLRRWPLPPTLFDIPLLIFLLTAAGALWAAYDGDVAAAKFWLIVGALLVYYAVADQPRSLHRWIILGLATLAAAVAAYFLFTHDWEALPAKIALLNRLGLAWQALRPALPGHVLHPNVAGGLLALLLPFVIAAIAEVWPGRRHSSWPLLLLALAGLALVLVALMLTTSRGAWLAAAAGLGLWLLWLLAQAVASHTPVRTGPVFILALLALGLLAVILVASYPGGPLALANSLPGPANAGSRLEIARDSLDLAADFPFTGAGLGAYAGLYSQYIRVIPFHFLIHSHNLFLDILVEQGILALGAFAGVLLGTIWLLARSPAPDSRRWATMASLTALVVHGMADDTLYGSRGLLLLFLVPGVAVMLSRVTEANLAPAGSARRSAGLVAVAGTLAAAAIILIFFQPLAATWNANLGAVRMAQIELADYPLGEWEQGQYVAQLTTVAAPYLLAAVRQNPEERTANFRLGLLAMQQQDYEAAASYLRAAYQSDPNHRGVRKAFAYTLVWTGQIGEATALLSQIPEARAEMDVYQWWWDGRGRQDLADAARQALALLEEAGQTVTGGK